MIVPRKDGWGSESPIAVRHQDADFGIVVSGWGNIEGAENAVIALRNWVKTLDRQTAQRLHDLLLRSDTAYGDDPIWEASEMRMLASAQLAARRERLRAGEDGANDAHECSCRLVPSPYH